MPSKISPTKAERVYRGVSAAERASERRGRLLEGGLELFGTRGIAATTIDDLCAEAKLTKRYFYESFASADQLAEAVLDHVVDTVAAIVLPTISIGPSPDPRPPITTFMAALRDDPRLARILFVETNHRSLSQRRHSLMDRAVALWSGAHPDSNDAQPAAIRQLHSYAFKGAMGEVVLALLTGRIDISSDLVTDQLVEIFERIQEA